MFTPQQLTEAKKRIHTTGKTIRQWAKDNDLPERPVYQVISGVLRGRNGMAHEIAVKLGLKPDFNN